MIDSSDVYFQRMSMRHARDEVDYKCRFINLTYKEIWAGDTNFRVNSTLTISIYHSYLKQGTQQFQKFIYI